MKQREIKFRVWIEEDEKMFYFPWYFGRAHGNTKGQPEKYDRPIMQYTGLKDKNGKEVYEGDIVREDYEGNIKIEEVRWSPTLSGFYPFTICAWSGGNCNCMRTQHCRVLGNIYENPELIKLKR